MTPLAGSYGRATTRIAALLVATLVFLGAAAQARAEIRYAVPGGTTSSSTCTSPGANCSLGRVLQDVVLTGDEVIVTPGTHNVGASGVIIKSGVTALNIHGQDGQARPRITATSSGFTFRTCAALSCVRDGTILRRLSIDNQGSGGGLGFHGGSVGSPLTIADVAVVAGSASPAILGFAQEGITSEALIRDTTAYATGPGANGSAAIASQLNLTMRNVTAVASGNGAYALIQSPNCNAGACSGNASATVFNTILQGGPGGADVRTTSATDPCGSCFGNISLDYSNFDSVLNCSGCSLSPPGSAHNQTAAPQLVNQAGGDFHQLSSSPTIDAGVDDPANGATDLDGNPRKLGSATDIGAFEAGRPLVVTEPATNVTGNGATLRGSVNPFGLPATYYFQWGTTIAYGNRIPATDQSAGSGTAAQAVSQDLAGLALGTTVHYRVVAANSFGSVFGNDQSFTTGVPGQSLDRTRPSISRLSLTHRRFRVASKATPVSARTRAPLGTTFRYSLSERARVTLRIDRALPGRRVGRSCRKPTRSNRTRRRCTRYVRAGTLTRRNKGPGRVRTAFSGRIGRRKLALGNYRATVGATDAAGNRAQTRRVSFSVVR